MSTKLYDDALIKKLQGWTKNTQVTVTKLNDVRRAFEVVADKSNDNPLQLPLLVLSRSGGFTIEKPVKTPLSHNGMRLDANSQKTSILNAISVSIPYQLDVYTRYQEEADEYIRNLVFNIINYPKLQVTIPYNNENRIHDANMKLSPDIEDNSDIPERLVRGQFVRMTLRIDIDDAYLFDVRYRDVYSFTTTTEIMDDDIKVDLKR